MTVKNVRMMVWVGVLGALATSILGQNTMIVLYLAPALVTYLFISRRVPAGSAARAAARSGGGGSAGGARSGGEHHVQGTPAPRRQKAPLETQREVRPVMG